MTASMVACEYFLGGSTSFGVAFGVAVAEGGLDWAFPSSADVDCARAIEEGFEARGWDWDWASSACSLSSHSPASISPISRTTPA